MASKTKTTKGKTKTLSVYEALTERKIYQKKLDKLEVSTSGSPTDIIVSSCYNADNETKTSIENKAKSNWDTLQAVLRNIDELTSKINESNAKTTIVIAGTEMTKVEAIYRYNHIEQRISIYTSLLVSALQTKREVEDSNSQLLKNTSELEKLINAAIGEQGERTYAEWLDARSTYREKLIEEKKQVLVDPYDLCTKLPQLIDESNEFREKFNLEMNKSNLVTMIDVCLED